MSDNIALYEEYLSEYEVVSTAYEVDIIPLWCVVNKQIKPKDLNPNRFNVKSISDAARYIHNWNNIIIELNFKRHDLHDDYLPHCKHYVIRDPDGKIFRYYSKK